MSEENKKLIPLENYSPETRMRSNLYPSMLFQPNSQVRAGDLQLQVVSTNDKKDCVTLKLVGTWLEPKEPPKSPPMLIVGEDKPPIFIQPRRGIITP